MNPFYLILRALAKVLHISLDTLINPDVSLEDEGVNQMKMLYSSCPPEMRDTLLHHTQETAKELTELSEKFKTNWTSKWSLTILSLVLFVFKKAIYFYKYLRYHSKQHFSLICRNTISINITTSDTVTSSYHFISTVTFYGIDGSTTDTLYNSNMVNRSIIPPVKENIRLAFQGIWAHKMRSFLTMLGIIIGIASIISIVSTIKGTNEQIKKNLIGEGDNVVEIKLKEGGGDYQIEYEGLPQGVPVLNESQKEEILEIPEVVSASFYRMRDYADGI